MDLFDKCQKYDLTNKARKAGIYPYFHVLESRQGPEVVMEGKRKIMLGSNNYLGLTTHPEVIEASRKAVDKYGTGCSGSRFLNGTLDMHVQLEKELAEFLNMEEVVTFSTGFQSNLGIISTILGRHDYVLCDRENHASIYAGIALSGAKMLRYKHSDMNDLERQLKNVPENAGILIVTDGVFSMGGDICKLPEIVKLKKKYGARIMVDDAHGLGVIGKCGRGTASHFGLESEVDIIMGTFSKSLASLGGYMAASHTVSEYVRHTSKPFIFSASIAPSSCAAALASLNVLRNHPEMVERLGELSLYLRKILRDSGLSIHECNDGTPIVPIHSHDINTTLYWGSRMFNEGVYVNPVLPPAVAPSDCLLRLSIMASHTEALLDEAVSIITKIVEEGNVPCLL